MFLFIVTIFALFTPPSQMYNLFKVENLWDFNSFISFPKYYNIYSLERKEY